MAEPSSTQSAIELRRAGPYRWVLLLGLVFCSWAIIWYGFTIGIMLPDISADLGLRPAQEGWLSSSFFVGQLLFMIPLSHFLARFRPVRTMALAFAASALLLLVAAAAPGYAAQIGVRFSVSVLFVAVNPVRTKLISTWFREHEIAHANGVFNAGFGVVQAAALWASGPLLELVGGWRGMMGFFAALGAVATVVWVAVARDVPAPAAGPEQPSHPGGSTLHIVLRREVWYLSLVGVGAGSTWATFITFWPRLAEEELGLTTTGIGVVLGCSALAIAPGALLASRMLTLAGRRPLLVAATVAQVPAFALMLLTGNVFLLTAIGVAQGLLWFYFPILFTVPFQLRDIDDRGIAVATAVFITANSAALALGPSIGGVLAEQLSLRTVLLLASLGPLLSTAGAVLLGNERPPEPVASAELATG